MKHQEQIWLKQTLIFSIVLSITPIKSIEIIDSRIAGGNEQTVAGHESIGYLRRNLQMICAGTLQDNQWFLTAAHCVQGRQTHQLGIWTGYGLFKVEEILVHPRFSTETLKNNLALLKVTNTTKLSGIVKPYRLPEPNQYFTDMVQLLGFGSISPRYNGWSGLKPNLIELPVTALTRCKSLYNKMNIIDDGIICAGNSYQTGGLCQGDAGAPLIQWDQSINEHVLVGIGSFSFDCGLSKYPSVFTSISKNTDWINETMIFHSKTKH